MIEIHIPVASIVITLDEQKTGGSIRSNLKDDTDMREDAEYLACIDGIESVLLAMAIAGVDLTKPSVINAIRTAVEAAANHFEGVEMPKEVEV